MTTQLIEAARLALEALGYAQYDDEFAIERGNNAIIALHRALANSALDKMAENARELGLDYEQPAQNTPMTEEQIQQMIYQFKAHQVLGQSFYAVVRATELFHGIG